MKAKKVLIVVLVLGIIALGIFLVGTNRPSPVTGNVISENPDLIGDPDKITIYFFWGDGCPHCENQKVFLDGLAYKYSGYVEFKEFETWKNRDNLEIFQEVAKIYGIQARGVPTTFIGEKHWVGYLDYMGDEMEGYITYCIENKCENPLEKI